MPFRILRGDPALQGCEAAAFAESSRVLVSRCSGPSIRLFSFRHASPLFRTALPETAAGLEDCYRACLRAASRSGCRSIAFPLLCPDGAPREAALTLAMKVLRGAEEADAMEIVLALDERDAAMLSGLSFPGLDDYVNSRLLPPAGEPDAFCSFTRSAPSVSRRLSRSAMPSAKAPASSVDAVPEMDEQLLDGALFSVEDTIPTSLEELLAASSQTFSEKLMELINESGLTNKQVYTLANMDRRLYSKILSNRDYHPRKNTVLALIIALKLDMPRARDLLSRAGYAFSPCSPSDLIVQYFIETGRYDIHAVNLALFSRHLPDLNMLT